MKIRAVVWLGCMVFAPLAWGQELSPAVPVPSGSIPSSGVTGGSIGSQLTYIPGDAAPPLSVQAMNVTLGTNCLWTGTFGQSFVSSTPIVHAAPVQSNSDTQVLQCAVTARSSATESGKCFFSQTTVLNLSIITTGLTLFPYQSTTCPADQLMIIGREPTQ